MSKVDKRVAPAGQRVLSCSHAPSTPTTRPPPHSLSQHANVTLPFRSCQGVCARAACVVRHRVARRRQHRGGAENHRQPSVRIPVPGLQRRFPEFAQIAKCLAGPPTRAFAQQHVCLANLHSYASSRKAAPENLRCRALCVAMQRRLEQRGQLHLRHGAAALCRTAGRLRARRSADSRRRHAWLQRLRHGVRPDGCDLLHAVLRTTPTRPPPHAMHAPALQVPARRSRWPTWRLTTWA